MTLTYTREVVPAAYRVETEKHHCLVIAHSHDEAVLLAQPEIIADITHVTGPHPIKPNGVYINR